MKFSEQWLKEWVPLTASTQELTHRLTMAGLEVEGVTPVAAEFSMVVVGQVIKITPHNNADALQVCQVDVGAEEPLQIVCGAKNVVEGMKVPTALVGAKLPGDFSIKKAKLRGEPSFGMLCASAELGLAEQSEGLMTLPKEARVGSDFRSYLQLDDNSIEVDLTPNRGDCLSIRGIARELGVLYQLPITEPEVVAVKETSTDTFPIEVKVPEACPRYLGCVIRQVNPTTQTPLWMQEKLRRSGLRSLGALVDVTNYVLLEYGQPLHAFDLDKLDTQIVVRMAASGEQITLLDGQEKTLNAQSLVIADMQGPIALAGIMGGSRTAVDNTTQHILLECAYFSPQAIAGRSRQYGIQTDASHRFERGVDWRLQTQALYRAAALIRDITGGDIGPVIDITNNAELPKVCKISLRQKKIDEILGFTVEAERITDMLTRLGMLVEPTTHGWMITPPSYRFDIEIEADLIEEIARVFGYDNLPVSNLRTPMSLHALPEAQVSLTTMKQTLVDRGYQEIISYSFVTPDLQRSIEPDVVAIPLQNPISKEMSVMRTTLWVGLLQSMVYNRKRQVSRIRIFESGLRFLESGSQVQQDNRLAGLVTGMVIPEQWGQKARSVDFYDVKSDVLSILSLAGEHQDFTFVKSVHPALHPGQSAQIYRHDKAIGWLGLVHPKLEQQLGLGQKVFVFDLSVGDVVTRTLPKYESLSKYPSIRRDIAIIVNEAVEYEQVSAIIKNNQNYHLKETILFDVYRGENLKKDQKSLAVGLILQDDTKTLTDEEVDTSVNHVIKMLSEKLGATLRD